MTEAPPAELPNNARLIYTSEQITGFIARMAAEIAADFSARYPIVMPVLMGGAFTAVRLTAHFRFPYEMDSLRVARYTGQFAREELHWYARPCLELDGRHVLLVDDVLDHGVTLQAVERELRRMNAASVSAAVLIRKSIGARADRPAVDYVGADAPADFLFGCGMDLDGRWRGLPALYAQDPEANPVPTV
jgi:hypoxanthine phosphoribosyltransferase